MRIKFSQGSVYKKGRRWYVSITITRNGIKKRDMFPAADNKPHAQAILRKIKQDLFLEQTGAIQHETALRKITLDDALVHYLIVREKMISYKGVKEEKRGLEKFQSVVDRFIKPDYLVDLIIPEHVRFYFEHLATSVSGATVNRQLTTVKKFFDYAVAMQWTKKNPCAGVKRFRVKRAAQPRAIPRAELKRFFEALEEPHKLFAEMLYYTASRRGEILSLKGGHLDIERRVVMIQESKSNKRKITPLNRYLLGRLAEIEISPDGFIFESPVCKGQLLTDVRKAFDRASRKANIDPPVRPKHLRSTAASHIAENTELSLAQKALDHSSPRTTSAFYIYHEAEKIRGVFEGLTLATDD